MTSNKWDDLTPEEQTIKMAELDGWKFVGRAAEPMGLGMWEHPTRHEYIALQKKRKVKRTSDQLPDYLTNLNVMHGVFSRWTWTDDQVDEFENNLEDILQKDNNYVPQTGSLTFWYATAAQLAKAFVLTMETT